MLKVLATHKLTLVFYATCMWCAFIRIVVSLIYICKNFAAILGSAGTGQFGSLGVSWNCPAPEALVPSEDDLGECWRVVWVSDVSNMVFYFFK